VFKEKIAKKVLAKISQVGNPEKYVEVFQEILAHLSYLNLWYHSCHWLSKDKEYYSDHLLFDRLYSVASSNIDALAEKAIVTSDESAVDRGIHLEIMLKKEKMVKEMQKDNKDFVEISILLESELLQFLADKTQMMSQGTQNLLDDISEQHETNLYLLNQRKKT
jgi:DNA-binding ferritin-like protein